jgi:hypothetical protein
MNKRILLFILIITLTTYTSAQDDVSKYFDDGGVAEATRLFKIGYDPLNGEIPLIFEHRLTTHISLEWGAGPVSLKRQAKLYKDIQDTSTLGFNMWANLRVYLKGYYERFYIGIQPRLNFLDKKTYTDIIFFNCGYQLPLYGRWVFDINAGMGVRSYKLDDVYLGGVKYNFGRDSQFVVPIQGKLGYAF